MADNGDSVLLDGINRRLNVLIALQLRSQAKENANAKRNIGSEALLLSELGLAYDEIAKITGSTRDSVTELVGRARRSTPKRAQKKAAKKLRATRNK